MEIKSCQGLAIAILYRSGDRLCFKFNFASNLERKLCWDLWFQLFMGLQRIMVNALPYRLNATSEKCLNLFIYICKSVARVYGLKS